jgi:hypothetical protein
MAAGQKTSAAPAVQDSRRAQPVERIFNVREYRARGDGKTFDTKAIQDAIDACHQAGGGAVLVPKGTYLSGTITLKDTRLSSERRYNGRLRHCIFGKSRPSFINLSRASEGLVCLGVRLFFPSTLGPKNQP